MYKSFADSSNVALRRRARNEDDINDDTNVPLSQVNVDTIGNDSDGDDIGPDVRLAGTRSKFDAGIV